MNKALGGKENVADLSASTFKQWIVDAFQMDSNKGLSQAYFIYSCDVATGGDNLLLSVAQHVASKKIRERTFIGTAGENGVINKGQGIGKILVNAPDNKTQQNLGLGWKGYRIAFSLIRAGIGLYTIDSKGSRVKETEGRAKPCLLRRRRWSERSRI